MNIPFYRLVEVAVYSQLNLMPFLLLALYLFRRHLRFPRHTIIVLLIGMALLQTVMGFLTAFFFVSSEVMSLFSTFVYAGFFFLAVKDHPGRQTFVLLALANLGNLVSICAKCMEGMLFGELALQNYRWSMLVCMLVMHALITLPITLYVRRYFTSSVPIHNKYWAHLWLIPAAFYSIWYYHLYFAGHSSQEIAMSTQHALFLVIVNAGALVVYHMAILLLFSQEQNAKLAQNNYLLTLQNIQYEHLQQRIDETRQARHDVRHHALMSLEYLRDGKLPELEAYLEQYCSDLDSIPTVIYCQNYEANTLLNYFAHIAQKHNIQTDIQVQFPQELALPETTLSVLLSNLLENAVDACREITDGEKRICVKGTASDGFVYFDISNTYTGTLHKARNGNYRTTKKDGTGLGLQSVSHLVKLHNGIMEVDTKDHIFRVSVMLRETTQA